MCVVKLKVPGSEPHVDSKRIIAETLVETTLGTRGRSGSLLKPPKNSRVVLLKPPLYTCETFSPIRSAQPLGIWQLGSFLQTRGYEVRIIDCVIEGWDHKMYLRDGSPFDYSATMRRKWSLLSSEGPAGLLKHYPITNTEGKIGRSLIRTGMREDDIVGRIRDFEPGWIGISIIATSEHRGAMDLARRLRAEFPDAIIVAGGQHATDLPETVLSEGTIDLVVKGNGELIMERLLNGRIPERGLAFMQDGRLIEQPDAPLTPMEMLPPLDPLLLGHASYPLPASHSYATDGRRYADYMFSFGCHKRCDFCRQGNVMDGYRHLSYEQVKAQLRLFREYGIEELVLQDDSLLGGPRNDGKEFFLEVVRLLKDAGLHWHDNGGIEFERLDELAVNSILKINEMPGSGRCTALYVPFNPRHLEHRRVVEHHMQKMPDQLALLKKLRENGVYTFTSGIWGHVNQDVADMESDICGYQELLYKGIVDQVIIFGLSYLPRTKDWEYRGHIVDAEDWEGYSIFAPHARTKNASFDEVNHKVLEAYMRLNPLQPHVEPWASGFPPHIPDGWR